MVIIAEELARKSFDFFTAYGASVFCGLNLLRSGSPEQCARYLPKLLAGEIRMCVSMVTIPNVYPFYAPDIEFRQAHSRSEIASSRRRNTRSFYPPRRA